MAINRTNTQYKGVETLTDEQIQSALNKGIQVASKIKAQSIANSDTGVEAYVVDAFDIDWKGYKINNVEVRNTDDVLTILSEGINLSLEDTLDIDDYSDIF